MGINSNIQSIDHARLILKEIVQSKDDLSVVDGMVVKASGWETFTNGNKNKKKLEEYTVALLTESKSAFETVDDIKLIEQVAFKFKLSTNEKSIAKHRNLNNVITAIYQNISTKLKETADRLEIESIVPSSIEEVRVLLEKLSNEPLLNEKKYLVIGENKELELVEIEGFDDQDQKLKADLRFEKLLNVLIRSHLDSFTKEDSKHIDSLVLRCVTNLSSIDDRNSLVVEFSDKLRGRIISKEKADRQADLQKIKDLMDKVNLEAAKKLEKSEARLKVVAIGLLALGIFSGASVAYKQIA